MEENNQNQAQSVPLEVISTEPPSLPQENNKGHKIFSIKLLAVLLIAGFILIVGVGGAYMTLGKNLNAKPTPTQSPSPSPSPTLTPTPIVTLLPTTTKSTSKVSPTISSLQAGAASLTVNTSDGSGSVTIRNQSTGKITSGGAKTYQLDPGSYQVSIADRAGYKTGYSNCSSNCSGSSGNYNGSAWGNTTTVSIDANNPGGVFFYFFSQDQLPKCSGVDSPTCN